MPVRLVRGATMLLAAMAIFLVVSCGTKADDANASSDSTAMSAGGGMTADETKNIELTRQFAEKVFAQGDTAFAREHTDASYVEHNPMPGQPPGADGFVKGVMEMRAAFPDMSVTVDDIIASGDLVCIRNTMTGTNTGPMMGQPATGKPIKVEGIDIIRIKDGKQVEHWGQYDVIGMLTQMGVMPPMGDAGAAPAAGGAATDTSAKEAGK